MNDDDVLRDICNNLGLSYLQAKILIVLMKLGGESTAPELYNKIILDEPSVKRTTVYSSLEKLKKEKFIIESDQEDSKHKIYGLTHTSPDQILRDITKPKEMAFTKFKTLLTDAKNDSEVNNRLNPLGYYSLKGRKKLLNQIESLIMSSNKYILIQANVSMLENIFDLIKLKKQKNEINFFIQFTWNPNPELDIQKIYEKYTEILGENRVALPHPFYNEIFGEFKKEELLKLIPKNKYKFIPDLSKIHFIQLLTDEGSILGVHFNSPEGGGHYTRDPFTTQVHYNMFFLIFESSKGKKVDRSIVKKILEDRTVKNFLLVFDKSDD